MDGLSSAYDHHAFVFWLVLLLALLVVGFWSITAHRRARHIESRLDDILDGMTSESAATMLVEYLSTVRNTAAALERVKAEHDEVSRVIPSVIRHVGLVRFSPFHDTGSDQSFALALLDGRRDGVVITALHSRTDSRLYAKPVEHGASAYTLSPEEQEAMERALDGAAVARTG